MELITIILVVAVVIVVAYFSTEEKYGFTSPAIVIGQIASWASFGFLTFVDVSKLTVAATRNANVTAELAGKESGVAVDLGLAVGKANYKASEVRSTIVGATVEIHTDTMAKRAKLDKLLKGGVVKPIA